MAEEEEAAAGTGAKDELEKTGTRPHQRIEVGMKVDIKGYGRAVVIEPPVPDSSDPNLQGRVRVRYQKDGATYYCRPEVLRPVCEASKRVVVCRTTREYRAAMVQNLDWEDTCLEVGCHEGETAARMHERCRTVVATDKSAETIAVARRRFPHVRFKACDGFDAEALAGYSPTGTYTKIFIDIGGIAELSMVVAVLNKLKRHFHKAKLFVVKSVHLAALLRDSELFGLEKDWVVAPQTATPPSTATTSAQQAQAQAQDPSKQAQEDQ